MLPTHRKPSDGSDREETDTQPLLSPVHSPKSRTSHLLPSPNAASSSSSSSASASATTASTPSTALASLSRHLRLTRIRLHALLIPVPAALSSRPSLLLPLLLLLALLCTYTLYISRLSYCLLPPPLYRLLHPTPPATADTAWMDPREQALVAAVQQQQQQQQAGKGGLFMLEYGSGASSFQFSAHPAVSLYVSIEHDTAWCEAMAARAAVGGGGREVKVVRLDGDVAAALADDATAAPLTETLLYNRTATTSAARLHFYCVPPSRPPPVGVTAVAACVLRTPSPLSRYASYVHAARYLTARTYHAPADVVLVDGRARPQAAYGVLQAGTLRGGGRVLVHDWNERERYWEVLRWYDVVERQVESAQPGGGGLVVLKRKDGVTGEGGDELKGVPDWWW